MTLHHWHAYKTGIENPEEVERVYKVWILFFIIFHGSKSVRASKTWNILFLNKYSNLIKWIPEKVDRH